VIFVDTSALYAVLDRDDENHAVARTTWERLLRSSNVLLTHNYVLLETVALAQSRLAARGSSSRFHAASENRRGTGDVTN
jgi:predicted nucleic acid-binding protein